MKPSDIINYFTGTAEFETEQATPEDFITACMNESIDTWNMRKLDGCTLRFYCRMADAKHIRKIAEKCGVEKISEVPSGLPIQIIRRKKRYGLAAGAAVFITALILMSAVIWEVDISGYSDYTQLAAVTEFLQSQGLCPGTFSAHLDEETLRLNIMRKFDDIAGATVTFHGSVAEVELEQAKQKPESTVCEASNLVAEEDAQILSIRVYNGKAAVKKNDIVKKGQLLVSGVCDSKRIGFRLVHARALITARVNKKISVFIPYNEEVFIKTSDSKNVYTLNIFGGNFDLNKCRYENFTTRYSVTELKLTEDIILPISVKKTVCERTEKTQVKRTAEEALEKARSYLNEREAIGMKNTNIESKTENITYSREGVYAEYSYGIIKKIGCDSDILREKE